MRTASVLAAVILLIAPPVAPSTLLAQEAAPPAIDRGIRLFEAGKYDAAIGVLEAAAAEGPHRGLAVYFAGRAWMAKGDNETAAARLQEAVKQEPANAEYHLWLGRAYGLWARQANVFRKMSLVGDVLEHLQRAVELAPENLDARSDLISFYLEVPGIAGGSVEKALKQAEEIGARDPIRGHFAQARIWEKEEQFDKAVAAYEAALRGAPDSEDAYFRLAFFHQRRKDFDGAHRILASLAEAQPNNMRAHYQIGRNGALSGTHLEPAARSLERYLSEHTPGPNDPSKPWAHVRLGQVYRHMGDKAKARAEFESALALDPENEEAKKELKSVR